MLMVCVRKQQKPWTLAFTFYLFVLPRSIQQHIIHPFLCNYCPVSETAPEWPWYLEFYHFAYHFQSHHSKLQVIHVTLLLKSLLVSYDAKPQRGKVMLQKKIVIPCTVSGL